MRKIAHSMIIMATLPSLVSSFDLPDEVTEDIKYAHIMPKPKIAIDSEGSIHILFLSSILDEPTSDEILQYIKYDGSSGARITKYPLRGFFSGSTHLYVSDSGSSFTTFAIHEYGDDVIIYNENDDSYIKKSLLEGATGGYASLLPGCRLIYRGKANKSAFIIIDQNGNQGKVGSMPHFQGQLEALPFGISSNKAPQLISFDGNELYIIGPSSRDNHNRIAIIKYNLSYELIEDYSEIDLIKESRVIKTDIPFNEIRAVAIDGGKLFIAASTDTGGKNGLCYFTLNKDLVIPETKQELSVFPEHEPTLADISIQRQIIWFMYSEEKRILGKFYRLAITEDKIYISESENLIDHVYLEKKKRRDR